MDQDTTLGTATTLRQRNHTHSRCCILLVKVLKFGTSQTWTFQKPGQRRFWEKNHFPSASASFCFKMTFCIQQHELSFELSEFSLTQSSLAGSGFRRHSVALSAAGASGKAALSCVDSWKTAMKITRCFLCLVATWLRSSKLYVCEEISPSSPVAVPPSLAQHTFKCPGFPIFLGCEKSCPRWQPFEQP